MNYIVEQKPYENGSYIMSKLNEYLADKFCLIYDGGYRVYKDDIRYSLYLNFMNYDKPMIISGEFFSDDDFVSYLIKEMRMRHLFDNKYYKVLRVNEEDMYGESCNKQ